MTRIHGLFDCSHWSIVPFSFFNFIYIRSIWLKLLESFLVEVARKKLVILTVDYTGVY